MIIQDLEDNPFIQLQREFTSYYKLEQHIKTAPVFKFDEPEQKVVKVKPSAQEKNEAAAATAEGKKKKKNRKKKNKKEKTEFKFQFISILGTIGTILQDKNLVPDTPTPEGYLKDVKDGRAYKENEYFKANPEALTIMLYSDAVEMANPLGAKKTVYKVVNLYLTLGEIPKHLRSKTENHFLVLTVLESDLKDHREEVLGDLLEELLQLQKGVMINDRLVKGGLLAYTGDNLELHCVGGFSMNFSSGKIYTLSVIFEMNFCACSYTLTSYISCEMVDIRCFPSF